MTLLKLAYAQGYDHAFAALELEKEAGVVRSGVLGGIMGLAPILGLGVGAQQGTIRALKRNEPAFLQLMEKAERVPAQKFIEQHSAKFAPGIKWANPEKGYSEQAATLISEGRLPKDFDPAAYTKFMLDANKDSPQFSWPTNTIISGENVSPSILAHEMGHGTQKALHTHEQPATIGNLFDRLSGRVVEQEQGAWDLARKAGMSIDPAIEEAAMGTYRSAEEGGRWGGGLGGLVGLLASGLAGRSALRGVRKKP